LAQRSPKCYGAAMPDNAENLVLEHLRAISSDVAAIKEDAREVKPRLGQVDIAISAIRGDLAHAEETAAIWSVRLDRVGERIERIENRLELIGN